MAHTLEWLPHGEQPRWFTPHMTNKESAMADKRNSEAARERASKSAELGDIERTLSHSKEVEGDDVVNIAALREAVREHSDVYLIATDMEDADERSFPAVTREQK